MWRILAIAFFSMVCLPAVRADDTFELTVRPLLHRRCIACHGPDVQQAGIRLDRPITAETVKRVLTAVNQSGPVKMPPSGQLPEREIAVLEGWARSGAPHPRVAPRPGSGSVHWAFRPLRRPLAPPIESAATDIDAFVRAKLQQTGLAMAPPADKRTLLRRVTVDLTGLPPTPEETAAFLADRRPDAYERWVDRLLASPAYGERMARPWLDLVRYADSNGYERDAEKPFSWRYRDWVIDAFNADMPYNRFVTEQLAGDELPDRTESSVVATGFLRLGTWDDEPNDPAQYPYERLDDLVHATSTAFLGLTLRCARCHDHKFDPIPQRDYYRIANAFWAGYLSPGDGKLVGGPPPQKLGFSQALGFTDRGPDIPPMHLLISGDPHRPGDVVPPGYLSILPHGDRPVAPPPPGATTTTRRRQLAAWITDPSNPLPARVAVNRLWQHHFGRGLVATSDNFGRKGALPSHPELLDWLADELIDGGWRLKPIHRKIVLSQTYRQRSETTSTMGMRKDAKNALLWRFPRQRLDADALRDAILSVSGQLNPQRGGRGFVPSVTREALEGLSRKGAEWSPSPLDQQRRRSVYLFLKRALIPPLMTTFDAGDTTAPLARRDVTTVAPQALALLNNPFLHAQADAFARRLEDEVGGERARQVERAFALALGRRPGERERSAAMAYLNRYPREMAQIAASTPTMPAALRLWLRADQGVEVGGDGRVRRWADQSGNGFDAVGAMGPERSGDALRFDGTRRFLTIPTPVVTSPEFTLVAIASDSGSGGHRELFSNWNGAAGNAGTSVFLGVTGAGLVRFTDAFAPAGVLETPTKRHLLTAVAGKDGVAVYQNRSEIARSAAPLPQRNLSPPFVVGQQGNIDGEFWNGEIVELLVFDRALTDREREGLWDLLDRRHPLALRPTPADPALASLCRILLNTNEFIYVD